MKVYSLNHFGCKVKKKKRYEQIFRGVKRRLVIINREKPMRIGELPNTFSLSGRVNFTYCLNITQKLLLWDKGEKTSL